VVALGVVFPVYINTYHGIRTIAPQLVEMAKVRRLGPVARFWRVNFTGALPSIFAGQRYGLGIMWLTLILAETNSASTGIGYMTMNAREFLQTDVITLGVII
jgi:sulfonate transport system permease protein